MATTLQATAEDAPFIIRDVANSEARGDYRIVVHGEAKPLFWTFVRRKLAYPAACECRIELDLSELKGLYRLSLNPDLPGTCVEQQTLPVASVILPNTVTFIGEAALANSNLEAITLPESVQFIARAAFQNCKELREVSVPSVAFIAPSAFAGCSSGLRVQIAEGVGSIAATAFPGSLSIAYAGTKKQWEKILVKPYFNDQSRVLNKFYARDYEFFKGTLACSDWQGEFRVYYEGRRDCILIDYGASRGADLPY